MNLTVPQQLQASARSMVFMLLFSIVMALVGWGWVAAALIVLAAVVGTWFGLRARSYAKVQGYESASDWWWWISITLAWAGCATMLLFGLWGGMALYSFIIGRILGVVRDSRASEFDDDEDVAPLS